MVNCELKMATRRSQRERSQVKRLIAEVDSQTVAIERKRRNETKVAKKDENLGMMNERPIQTMMIFQ